MLKTEDKMTPKLRHKQAGFRPRRSCADHIFTMCHLLEQSQEWNSTIYANFIDFKKAFDSGTHFGRFCYTMAYQSN